MLPPQVTDGEDRPPPAGNVRWAQPDLPDAVAFGGVEGGGWDLSGGGLEGWSGGLVLGPVPGAPPPDGAQLETLRVRNLGVRLVPAGGDSP